MKNMIKSLLVPALFASTFVACEKNDISKETPDAEDAKMAQRSGNGSLQVHLEEFKGVEFYQALPGIAKMGPSITDGKYRDNEEPLLKNGENFDQAVANAIRTFGTKDGKGFGSFTLNNEQRIQVIESLYFNQESAPLVSLESLLDGLSN